MREYKLRVLRPCGALRFECGWSINNASDRDVLLRLFSRLSTRHRTEIWQNRMLLLWSTPPSASNGANNARTGRPFTLGTVPQQQP